MLSEVQQSQLSDLVQKLLMGVHEMSFEYCTMECEELQSCPLARKAKEIFKYIKSIDELVRSMMRTQKAY